MLLRNILIGFSAFVVTLGGGNYVHHRLTMTPCEKLKAEDFAETQKRRRQAQSSEIGAVAAESSSLLARQKYTQKARELGCVD